MRYYFVISLSAFLFVLFAGTASAEDARAILDRAIRAHGGAAQVERTKKGHLKGKLEIRMSGSSREDKIEEWFDLPARIKRIVDTETNGTLAHVEFLFIGKEGWKQEGTRPVQHYAIPQWLLAEQQQWYAVLAVLLLLRGNDAQLTSLPEQTMDGRRLAGIHAVCSQSPVDLYFDKSTGLLRRSNVTALNHPDGEEEIDEILYDDYRDLQGIHYPMRFKVAAKKYSSTVTLSTIEFLDKIDDSVFAKPHSPAAEGTVEYIGAPKTSSQPATQGSENTPEQQHQVLIVVTLVAGAIVGAVWFIVRASKRGQQEPPPS